MQAPVFWLFFDCISDSPLGKSARRTGRVITRSGLQQPFLFQTCSSFRQGSCQVSSFASAALQPHVHAWQFCACSCQCSSAVTCSCCSCLLLSLLSSSSLLLLSTPGKGGLGLFVRGGEGRRSAGRWALMLVARLFSRAIAAALCWTVSRHLAA